jgi:hyperosmotically inducible periplasmic protein
MARYLVAALVALTLVSTSHAQGPIQRIGQALDRAGKNIRGDVEGAVARGQMAAQDRGVLVRVSQRLNWDRRFAGSAIQIVVRGGGTVYLRGSVLNPAAKALAVDLVGNTLGVTRVVDELAVVRDVKVIQARPLPADGAPTVVVPSVEPLPTDGAPTVTVPSAEPLPPLDAPRSETVPPPVQSEPSLKP